MKKLAIGVDIGGMNVEDAQNAVLGAFRSSTN